MKIETLNYLKEIEVGCEVYSLVEINSLVYLIPYVSILALKITNGKHEKFGTNKWAYNEIKKLYTSKDEYFTFKNSKLLCNFAIHCKGGKVWDMLLIEDELTLMELLS